MSGAFPISTSAFSTMGIRSSQNTIISLTDSGKKLSRQIDGQRFGFTAKIITAKRDEVYGLLMAFIMKQRSGKENFTIVPPELKNAKGHENGTVQVDGVHSAGDTTIDMDGFAHDGTKRFKAGDFIKFANHSKVYMVIEDVTASSNSATVTIEPPLVSSLADDEVVTYDNVPFTVYLTNDIQEFGTVGANASGDLLYQFELDVEEAL
jgi:hypothetical protein